MTEPLHRYLSRPNPQPITPRSTTIKTSWTFDSDWNPVEILEEWTEFNYNTLQTRFSAELNQLVSSVDVNAICEAGGYNKIYDERGLSDLICMSITGPVSAVLDRCFLTSGARVKEPEVCFPDWGAGRERLGANINEKAEALLVGDTKFNWRSQDAIDLVRKIRPGLTASYDHDEMRKLVAPIEQVQNYGAIYRCRYVFLIDEEELIVMRLHLEPDAVRTSPRPQRTRPKCAHQRVLSSSTVSDKFSDMSLDETDFEAHIGRMEYKQVPWSATSGLTVKLALYCLVRLAAEDGSDLKEEYPPLLSTFESAAPRRVP